MSESRSETEHDIRASDNYVGSFVQLAQATSGGEVLDFGGVTVAATGVNLAMFNVAFMRRADAVEDLSRAVGWLRSRGLPFLTRCVFAVDAAACESIASIGLKPGSRVPGMTLPNSVDVGTTIPEGLDIVVAREVATMQHHADVCAGTFGVEPEIVDLIFSAKAMALAGTEFYVGYVDGVAVAASALFMNHGVAGVYNVATSPTHRRLGFGAAMTGHAVRRGRSLGASFSALQSTAVGRTVYERMGFRETIGYATFLDAMPQR